MLTVALVVAVLILCGRALAETHHVPRGLEPDQRVARRAVLATFGRYSPAAVSVAYCESRLHPAAIGGNNVGLFQINYDAHHLVGERWPAFVRRFTDVGRNVAYAFNLSNGGRDWSAWTCQP